MRAIGRRDYCRQSARRHVSISNWSFSVKFGITGYITIRDGFGMQVAKTPTYPVMYLFQLFVALCDHNPPTLQTDGRTDVMLVA